MQKQTLIQLFLPLQGEAGAGYPRDLFDCVRGELTERFGGVTAYLRSPAAGAWEDDDGDVQRDRMVLLEVMADRLDHRWWDGYRRELEQRFAQEEILVRAFPVERL
ncbi:hypothetical protein LY625_07970 [Lysobacter sp. GX 14042]|uniref:hypothetical protein n=1 Tax=Lysobacter sp. GX 14042 TaxID=2907155 RepID=UPI001F23795F|nr:hypothetical protein [Lysobacter sp. GX 14042]MCE7032548.1 hypothetical protein [Lysobacter sp. GX 14042]